MYLFMGFFVFSNTITFQLVVAILFWIVFILLLVCHFAVGNPRSPLLQKEPPSFELTSSDFFSKNEEERNTVQGALA